MNRYIKRLRGVEAARQAGIDASLSDSQGSSHAAITLCTLSGVEFHSLKGKNSSDDTDGESGSVKAASPATAKVAVWYQETSSKSGSTPAPVQVLSCYMTEESMDDEGNVLSWSCEWPSEASSLDVPFSTAYNINKKYIPLHVGIQHPGQEKIQPLGIATVKIPDSCLTPVVLENEHPPLEVEYISTWLKKSKSLSSRLSIRSKKMHSEYSISSSTVLKIELQMPQEKQDSTELVFDRSNTDAVTENETENDRSTMIMSEMNTQGDPLEKRNSVEDKATSKPYTESRPSTSKTEMELAQLLGRNTLWDDSKTISVGSKSKTVKAANIGARTDASNASEELTIDSDESVLDGFPLAKSQTVIVAPFVEKLREPEAPLASLVHLSYDEDPQPIHQDESDVAPQLEAPSEQESDVAPQVVDAPSEDGNPMECNTNIDQVKEHGSPKLSKNHKENNAPDHEPLFAVIELKETDSDISAEITEGSYGESPNADVVPKAENPKIQKNENRQQRPQGNTDETKLISCECNEINACTPSLEEIYDDAVEGFQDIAPSLEEIYDDAVEGFQDIVSCTMFMDEIFGDEFGDDDTCRTDCTSLETYESTIASYEPTVQSDVSTHAVNRGRVQEERGGNKKRSRKARVLHAWAGRPRVGTRAVDEPLSKVYENDQVIIMCNSGGGPSTPQEKQVQESKFDCDQSASVFSV